MDVRFLTLIFLISILLKCSQADYFTSIGSLHKLWEAETALIENMEHMFETVQSNIEMTSKFIDKYDKALQKVNKYHETPLKVFKGLRRITQDVIDAEIRLTMDNSSLEASYNEIISKLEIQPSEKDLKGAAVGIVRLQNTYNLKVEDIAAGILKGQQVSSVMSAEDCYILGSFLYESEKYTAASQWLMQAKKLWEENDEEYEEFPDLELVDVLDKLVKSLIESDNIKLAKRINEKLREHVEEFAAENDELLARPIVEQPKLYKDENRWKENPATAIYTKVCSGEVQQSPREQRHLRCRYLCNLLPDCVISPYRVEEYSLDPYVTVFHNVIYESEMQLVRNISLGKLERSSVGNSDTATEHDIRISQTAWIYFNNHSDFYNLQHRLIQMTDLSLEYAETFQVVNYGVGGYYYPHFDFFEFDDLEVDCSDMGNRILTALFYLNDVEMGGSTAFPYLKIAVPPQKGSALLWFNVHRDLNPDYRTYHTGCPVLKGSKWIATQWFHEFGQEFLRKCALQPDHSTSLEYKDLELDIDNVD